MPQTFQVLRCYKCSVFQVHQTNKSNKWECKLCGEKQSVKRFYGLGTAKECRFHVQKLNAMRGEIDGMKNNTDQDSDSSKNTEPSTEPVKDTCEPVKDSKWSSYVEETKTAEENTNDNMSLGGAEVVLEIPKKRRKQNGNDFNRNPTFSTVKHGQIHKNYIPTPVIVPNPMVNTQSLDCVLTTSSHKTAQPSLHFKTEEEPMNKIKHNFNQFIPPVINKNSKWSEFTSEEPFEAQTDILLPSDNLVKCSNSRQTSQNNLIFSSCDDKDIDNILQI